jgi:predicted transcriptional regulator
MKDREIRGLVMRGHSDKIRALLLTRDDVDTVRWVGSGGPGVTTGQLATRLGCSIQSASARLSRLWRRGYLTREEHTAPSGGIEYFYLRAKL